MNTSTRGTKRKRPANEKKKENTSTISTKLHHSLQLINRAAKKAKTFEVQKLVRKIKDDKGKKPATAGSSPEELASVLDALKELDVDTFVTAVWLSRLSKDKTGLAENEHVKQYCDELRRKEGAGKQATEDPSSPAGKAKNRIMAHKVFQEELKSVLKGLKEKAGLEDRASGSSARKDKPVTATPASSKDKKGREDESDALAALAKLSAKKGKARQMDEDDSDATSDTSDEETSDEDEEDDDDATVSHISADEDEMRAAEIGFDGMTGGSDSDEDDEPSSASEAGDDDDNVSVASSSSFSVKKEKASKEKAKNEKALKEKPLPPLKTTTSAFLPSLAAGYTIGDEDGSVYGSDEDGAGSAQVVRKNRRGQRARQAIWEKKYGKNAKHVKKQNELHTATDASRARLRAEKEIEKLKRSGRYDPDTVAANLTALGGNARAWNTDAGKEGGQAGPSVEDILRLEREKKDEEWRKKKEREAKPIHGSWEAKKRQKELEQKTLEAKPQGKKIKF